MSWSPVDVRFAGTALGAGLLLLIGGAACNQKTRVWEWNLDAFIRYKIDWLDCSNNPCTDYPLATCNDCSYLLSNNEHVVRGGSYYDDPQNLRSSIRMHYDPNRILNDIGIRCARTP